MFCAQRPTSIGLASPQMAITSLAPRTFRGAQTVSAICSLADSTTTNSHSCLFCEFPASRPASRMRRATSSGIGVSA